MQMGLQVRSFGTGTNVRLPGPSQDRPNVYEFGTPYAHILQDLKKKDLKLSVLPPPPPAIPARRRIDVFVCSVCRYTQTGLIKMLERNNNETFHQSGKMFPERWYDMDANLRLDIVLTYEARVYDAVLQGTSRSPTLLPGKTNISPR